LEALVGVVGETELGQHICEHLVAGSLTTAGWADQHDTKSDSESLVKINYLGDKFILGLEAEVVAGLLNLSLERRVVRLRNLGSWEKILHDSSEKRQIVLQELRNVSITHSTNKHGIFVGVGVGSLEGTSHHKHRLYGSHTEIIMILFGELLRGKLVKLHHLLGKWLGIAETFSTKHDLSNKTVVGDHH
jgi:hypothetical protein